MPEKQTILQKNLQIADMVTSEWLLVNKKNDINGGPRWKPIRNWPHQHFVKIL